MLTDKLNDRDWQFALVAALMRLPDAERFETRTSLLMGVELALSRSESNAMTDLAGIVTQLARADPGSLLTVMSNARRYVGSESKLGKDLVALNDEAVSTDISPVDQPMHTSDLAKLRMTLVRLFPAPSDARRLVVAQNAGVGPVDAALFGKVSILFWIEIVSRAEKRSRLAALVAAARGFYPDDFALLFYADYFAKRRMT